MASVKLINKNPVVLSSIATSNFFYAQVSSSTPTIKIKDSIPFRIKITNTVIESYGPTNPSSLGAFVIGYNNYIL